VAVGSREEALANGVYAALVHPDRNRFIDVERRRGLATPRRTPVSYKDIGPSNGPTRPT